MKEVQYFINHIDFREFGVYVSDSIGIADALERKPVQSYDWSDYHGTSPDLTKPRFKERKIELKCFVDGENWDVMLSSFIAFKDQFTKSRTQRLHIVPFEFKTLAYEVYMQQNITLEKKFRRGRMVGVFAITLIEPNPIKKVLKTKLDTIRLSYKSDSETEIFFGDGTRQIGRGDVSLTKDYSSPSYQGSGFNLTQISSVNSDYFQLYMIPTGSDVYLISVNIKLIAPENFYLYLIGRKENNEYEAIAVSSLQNGETGINSVSIRKSLKLDNYTKFILKALDDDGNEIGGIKYENPTIETAEILGDWVDMLGKEKVLIIAGNIEDIMSFSSDAEILWEKI